MLQVKMRNTFKAWHAVAGAVLVFLCLGAEPSFADGPADLLEAARMDSAKTTRLLMLRGVDPNISHKTDGPVIVYAAREKSFAVVMALLEDPRTQVNAPNAQGETALMFACLHGELKVVQALVAKGAEINRAGWTPLHYAAANGHLEVVKYLVENDAYMDANSPGNITPLMLASRHSQVGVAHFLVEEGADPTLKSDQGMTAADYWKRIKDVAEEAWMRRKAEEFQKKYGTVESPVLVKPAE